MDSKTSNYVSRYNNHYYNTRTKINRQLKRNIERAKQEFSQNRMDKDNYQQSWVNYLNQFKWTHFCVLKEDLLTSSINSSVRDINQKIKEINRNLPKEFRLPLQPLKARSLKSLQNYTERYFKFLIYRKLIDKVVYVFDQDKKGLWHVHALINLYKDDMFIDKIKEFWLLSNNSYIEDIEDVIGSLVYISKTFAKYNFNKIKSIENYNMLGSFTTQENPLKLKNMKYKELKNNQLTKEEKSLMLQKFKDKHNLHVIVNENFCANQKRLIEKYGSFKTAV
ncbi:hypothetical protein [Sphingobacterium siyangense]|uniref:hypothetical protein n=1 Tax=Sphingobacterium siyangense TaxID=459529 RepID=UPI001963CB1E|nr:hypothetical protein [Sphingobacterium siyangense]QRY58488.1 hypothetical protein JVX97_03140 [Sphingobacterium siyangense]